MNKLVLDKLKKLPTGPGIYIYKSKSREIIYIGKASVLKNRVRQYFQKNRFIDAKTNALVKEIHDLEWIETDSELDALFLEAEMIRRYMPRYNILLRDDKSLTYVRINLKDIWPYVSFTRNPIDDGAKYFGPYYNSNEIKKAMRYLRRIFPYYTEPTGSGYANKSNLDKQIGLSPNNLSSQEYKANLKKLISYIIGDKDKVVNYLEKNMQKLAINQQFEEAALIRNKIINLKSLKQQIVFGDREFLDISKDEALQELLTLLKLKQLPRRIEGFDISHMSGSDVVASMVVFKNGVSSRKEYRKFKTKQDKNDDFYNMHETILRRFSEKNIKDWGLPDLVLIDGGKGQLSAATEARNTRGQNQINFIGLAKKDETIIVLENGVFKEIKISKNSHVVKLLQRIRDEAHRFAVNYHSAIKSKRQKSSYLDEIPGIGPKTKRKLLKKFGSFGGIQKASLLEISSTIGEVKANLVLNYLKSYNPR